MEEADGTAIYQLGRCFPCQGHGHKTRARWLGVELFLSRKRAVEEGHCPLRTCHWHHKTLRSGHDDCPQRASGPSGSADQERNTKHLEYSTKVPNCQDECDQTATLQRSSCCQNRPPCSGTDAGCWGSAKPLPPPAWFCSVYGAGWGRMTSGSRLGRSRGAGRLTILSASHAVVWGQGLAKLRPRLLAMI